MCIMIVLMRSQPVTLLTRCPSIHNQIQRCTPVATCAHLHQSSKIFARNEIFLIILIATPVLLMMLAWEHYPNYDLSKWSSLLSPCMNISHRTAICLWLYLIAAEMMMLTMVMVLNAWRRTLFLTILESDAFFVM